MLTLSSSGNVCYNDMGFGATWIPQKNTTINSIILKGQIRTIWVLIIYLHRHYTQLYRDLVLFWRRYTLWYICLCIIHDVLFSFFMYVCSSNIHDQTTTLSSKLNYVSPPCIVIFSFIYCSSTLSGEHIHYQEICTYITLCKFRQESIYISPGLSIQSLFIYICVLSLYL